MREILFRAKRIDNGEWATGSYHHQTDYYGDPCDKHYIIDGTETDMEGYGEHYEIDPKTLCQYTELKDNNGKRIWENDIVKCNKRKDGFEFYKVLWRKYYADFGVEPLEFGIQYPIGLGENEQDIKGCNYEVIGNVFDNSELLKGDQSCTDL